MRITGGWVTGIYSGSNETTYKDELAEANRVTSSWIITG